RAACGCARRPGRLDTHERDWQRRPYRPGGAQPVGRHRWTQSASTRTPVARDTMANPDSRVSAAGGISALQRWYNKSAGLWNGIGWWNSANALTALIGYTKLTGDSRYAGVIGTTFTAARRQ